MKRNYIKRILVLALSATLALSVFTGCGSGSESKSSNELTTSDLNKDPKDYKGTITMWSFTDEFKSSKFFDEFHKIYPNIKVNLTIIPMDNNAYSTKLASVLSSGSGAPDVYTTEAAFVNRFVNMPYYENLSKAPYNGEDIAKNLVKYTVDVSRNQSDNGIRAFSWQATPGGIFYRRSLAKKYFGTDDPNEISKKFSSWDSLIAAGKELNEKSGGTVKLLPNYSETYTIATGSRKHAWVEKDKLVIDDNMMKYIDNAKQIRTAGIDDKLSPWSAPWSAGMAGPVNGKSIFGYVLPTWGLQSCLATNAPKTSGDWGLANAPANYYAGGTWIGMYSKSKNKALAWQLIKFMTTQKFQTWEAKTHSNFVSNLDAIKEIAGSNAGNSTFAGGQNLFKTYDSMLPTINGKLITKYDETINSKFQDNLDLYVTGKKTKDEFLKQFKADVKTAFPDLTVD